MTIFKILLIMIILAAAGSAASAQDVLKPEKEELQDYVNRLWEEDPGQVRMTMKYQHCITMDALAKYVGDEFKNNRIGSNTRLYWAPDDRRYFIAHMYIGYACFIDWGKDYKAKPKAIPFTGAGPLLHRG